MTNRFLSAVHGFLPSLRLSDPENATLAVLQAVAAEFFGTFVFVLLGIGSVTSGCHIADIVSVSSNSGDTSLGNAAKGSCALQSTTILNIATAFSFGLFIAIYGTAAISGGHLNPAVTLACFLAGKMSLFGATLYTGAQCLGAIISAAVVKGIDPDGFRAAGGAATAVNAENGVTPLAAWGVESILTFALVFTVFAATDSGRGDNAPHLPVLAPFAIGITVFVSHFFAIPLTGCSLNPARSFGPAVVAGAWKEHWVFWAGPCTGALVAFIVYQLLFSRLQPARASEAVEVDDGVTDIVEVGPKRRPPSDLILSSVDSLPAAQRSGSCPTAMHSLSIGNVMECVTPAGGGRRHSRQAQDSRLSRNPIYSSPTQSIPTGIQRVKTAERQGREYVQWPDASGSPASVNEWRRVVLHGAFNRSHA